LQHLPDTIDCSDLAVPDRQPAAHEHNTPGFVDDLASPNDEIPRLNRGDEMRIELDRSAKPVIDRV
jgi:hypothetical protein